MTCQSNQRQPKETDKKEGPNRTSPCHVQQQHEGRRKQTVFCKFSMIVMWVMMLLQHQHHQHHHQHHQHQHHQHQHHHQQHKFPVFATCTPGLVWLLKVFGWSPVGHPFGIIFQICLTGRQPKENDKKESSTGAYLDMCTCK